MKLMDAYQLMHDGALALADVESNGMMIDVEYCKRQDKHLTRRIERLQTKLKETMLGKAWGKKFKNKIDLDSNYQLGKVLFGEMKIKPTKTTDKGNPSVDQEALETMDVPGIDLVTDMRKLKKIRATYIRGLLRETDNGVLHPFFNLHLVRTYRSSSDHPNYQNIPKRDDDADRIVRRAFIPRPGRHLVEIDYSGIEVRIAACLHKDPVMLEYINDPSKDMHRDMACECYKLPVHQCTKQIRYCGKNMFVFPQFYGDYYRNCAKRLWEQVGKLLTVDGISLHEHLSQQGISTYEKFEAHIEEVENNFWNERFKVYTRWKKQNWNTYQATGEIRMLTGFRCGGMMDKKQANNAPMQGAAFHCLLWSLIRINRWLKEKGKETLLIGQIHDSLVFDAVPGELKGLVRRARKIMCEDIKRDFPWLIVPLQVEIEITPVDGSWYEKKEYDPQT